MKKGRKTKSVGAKEGDKDVYQYETTKIRNERNRAGATDGDDSDSDVLKGDDESIDDDASDIGWNSEDEVAFGTLFNKKKGGKRVIPVDADDDTEESDQEEAHDGEILLSDLLSGSNVAKGSAKHTKPVARDADNEEYSKSDIDGDSDNDDVGADDDEEEESEQSEVEDEEIDMSEDDGNDDEDAHNKLLSGIERFSTAKAADSAAKRSKTAHRQSAPESVFSSNADDGVVSMDALLGALGDAKGLKTVKKHLNDLDKSTKAPTFVEKVVSDRVERKIAYGNTSGEMVKWQDAVVANRSVRTLDLAQDKRQSNSYKDLVRKYEPMTDMEREVEMILVKTGATEDQAERREEDELGKRNMTIEEMRERQAEIGKVKALMFYEQMKRHRLNKIKSKAYRRIRKKQRERKDADTKELMEDADPEQARELEEEEAVKRVKERMDLKHKNTGKWARMALLHGHRDESLRNAYHEAVQLGHELSKKINEAPTQSRNADDDGEDSGDSGDDADEGRDSRRGGKRSSASARAAKEMMDVLGNYSEDQPEATGKYRKLFEMDFMKRAADQKKERAREEAQSILREVQLMEGGGEAEYYGVNDDDSGGDDDEDSKAKREAARKANKRGARTDKELAAAKKDAEERLGFGSSRNGSGTGGTGSGMMMLKSSKGKVKVSGPMSVHMSLVSTATSDSNSSRNNSRSSSNEYQSKNDATVSDQEEASNNGYEEANPWLSAPVTGKKRNADGQQTTHSSSGGGSKMKGKGKGSDAEQQVYVTMADTSTSTAAAASSTTVNDLDRVIEAEDSQGNRASGLKSKKVGKSKKGKNSDSLLGGSAVTITASKSGPVVAATTSTAASTSVTTSTSTSAGALKKNGTQERKPLLMQKSQEDLVQIAFAGPDLEEDFTNYKKQQVDEELGIDEKKKNILSQVKAGWGDWAGPGATGISQKTLNLRDRLMKKADEESEVKRHGRKDQKTPNVMLSERRVKTAAKYKIAEIPHPYTSREEYERSMQMPVGEEWNASTVVRTNTKPEILLRAGRIIEAIKLPSGKKRSSEDMGTPAASTQSSSTSSNKNKKTGAANMPKAKKAKK